MERIKNYDLIELHPAMIKPKFGTLRVLCDDPWSYVELLLKKTKQEASLSYWVQAREFLKASQNLSVLASPLPLYYCFLNATKAHLSFNSELGREIHGVSGTHVESAQAHLQNELVKFPNSGIAADLSKYLGTSPCGDEHSLKEILGTLPFVHRAFQITFPSE